MCVAKGGREGRRGGCLYVVWNLRINDAFGSSHFVHYIEPFRRCRKCIISVENIYNVLFRESVLLSEGPLSGVPRI